jgi:predicted nucleic acid-binding protein
LIDTSVAVEISGLERLLFSIEVAISALTLAEMATGPHAASDELTRARRQHQFRFMDSNIETLPFDSNCSRAYGQIYAAIASVGRKPRGARAVDLMIAATALAHDLVLYTRNASDLLGLEELIEIVNVDA